jgi:hypothetical protein
MTLENGALLLETTKRYNYTIASEESTIQVIASVNSGTQRLSILRNMEYILLASHTTRRTWYTRPRKRMVRFAPCRN